MVTAGLGTGLSNTHREDSWLQSHDGRSSAVFISRIGADFKTVDNSAQLADVIRK